MRLSCTIYSVIFQNVAHCKRKSSEQSDDEPLAKIQRGRMDAEKRVKLGKKVIKSKKISVSGSNTGDGESLQQQMISLSEQSLHTQGKGKCAVRSLMLVFCLRTKL